MIASVNRYLPELLLAAPVWFIEGKPAGSGSFAAAVRYFCDLGHSDPFAYVFQLYNDTPRAFGQFAGPDPVPLPLAGLITELTGRFDFLVIATPYHDLAFVTLKPLPKEAPPPPPLPRSVDPFLLGFLRNVPDYFFCLGRWSGTGLFPLIPEMIAATVIHLRSSREQFAAREWQAFAYKTETRSPEEIRRSVPRLRLAAGPASSLPSLPPPGGGLAVPPEAATLDRFIGQALGHFKAGSLFPWLRGEQD